MGSDIEFTPALGSKRLTPLYDLAIASLTREDRWRSALVAEIGPNPSDRILDVGCGTGTLAIQLKYAAPNARIVGIDPDPEVIDKARRKANKAAVLIEWRVGFLTSELTSEANDFSKVVCSLVFHQTPATEKQSILEHMRRVLRPGGTLHIADYGLQRTTLMRFLFRQTVQRLDGIADTQANADGALPDIMRSAGFIDVTETTVFRTPTGSISIYKASRPE